MAACYRGMWKAYLELVWTFRDCPCVNLRAQVRELLVQTAD